MGNVGVISLTNGIPMASSVGPCGLWYNMMFPCIPIGNCFFEYLQIQSPCGRLVSVEASAGLEYAELKTKNTFHDYMKATGELYHEDTGKLFQWS